MPLPVKDSHKVAGSELSTTEENKPGPYKLRVSSSSAPASVPYKQFVVSQPPLRECPPTEVTCHFVCARVAKVFSETGVFKAFQHTYQVVKVIQPVLGTVPLYAFDCFQCVVYDHRQTACRGVEHRSGFLGRPDANIGGAIVLGQLKKGDELSHHRPSAP